MGRRRKNGRRVRIKSKWNNKLKAERQERSRANEEGDFNPFGVRSRAKGTSPSPKRDWF